MIAVISQVYDESIAQKELVTYKHKAAMNFEFTMMKQHAHQLAAFQILVLQHLKDERQRDGEDDDADEVQGLTNQVKRYLKEVTNKLKSKVTKINQEIDADLGVSNDIFEGNCALLRNKIAKIKESQKKLLLAIQNN